MTHHNNERVKRVRIERRIKNIKERIPRALQWLWQFWHKPLVPRSNLHPRFELELHIVLWSPSRLLRVLTEIAKPAQYPNLFSLIVPRTLSRYRLWHLWSLPIYPVFLGQHRIQNSVLLISSTQERLFAIEFAIQAILIQRTIFFPNTLTSSWNDEKNQLGRHLKFLRSKRYSRRITIVYRCWLNRDANLFFPLCNVFFSYYYLP